jgi:pimeloyl-ACP methyl ester carboxylesterase
MYKDNKVINFDYISKENLVCFLHGYKGDKDELSFLRDYITKKKKFSFFSFSYGNRNNNIFSIYGLDTKIAKIIKNIIKKYSFQHLYLIGYSLGSALAVRIISRKLIKIDRLILISIFDNRKGLLASRGIKISKKENLMPLCRIKNIIGIKVFFIHGSIDRSIGLDRAKRVFDKLKQNNKFFFIIKGANHYFKNKYSKDSLIKALDNCFE